MGPKDISTLALVFCFLLLAVPLILSVLFRLRIVKSLVISLARMSIQLFLMAIYLRYLLEWDIPLLNLGWMMVMIVVASFTVVKNSGFKRRFFLIPVFQSLTISLFFLILFFNRFVLNLESIFEAKYFIVIGGMMLGNSIRGNVIGISTFFKDIKRNEERYLYRLALGASTLEAVMPYIRSSLTTALKPTIASMATIGIVFLPGMMTGQILGGASPMTAIKYQIAIMISIFVIISLATMLTLLFTLKRSFDGYGVLKKEIFSEVI
jgi:putative ABC transport system permease protein